MPTLTPLRPPTHPPAPPTYTVREKARGARRIIVWASVALVVLMAVLLTYGDKIDQKTGDYLDRTTPSSSTWATPLADWAKTHPGNPLQP